VKNLSFILLFSLFILSCGDNNEPGDNTSLPVVSIDALGVLEGNVDKSIFASIRLSKAGAEKVTIFLETADGTAEAGVDYLPISQSVVFEVGSVQENIRLDIIGDELSELDEDFTLSIINVNGATIGTGSVSVIIENDDLGNGTVVIPSSGYTTPESYDGLELIWSDEFSGSALDESNWTFEIGNGNWGWGNNELQFYREENTSIVDGHLVIEARNENFNGFNYTSSRIITRDKFEFQYGRVDIRAVVPEGQGIWPALWMLGENINTIGWPRCGEIDIMELVGHRPSTVHGTLHYPNPDGEAIPNGESINLTGGQKFSDEFHVFSLIWEEDRVRILMDDIQYHSVTKSSIGSQNGYPFNEPFFFIMNVATGGIWPGSPDATTVFPQHMIVDYIRVFQ